MKSYLLWCVKFNCICKKGNEPCNYAKEMDCKSYEDYSHYRNLVGNNCSKFTIIKLKIINFFTKKRGCK